MNLIELWLPARYLIPVGESADESRNQGTKDSVVRHGPDPWYDQYQNGISPHIKIL